ncbi:MAG: hypothetical protein E7241_03785 [Lachnospiraceae bacterium]|nr:hypothetical protein [Lachnospiraceae bacterium]
MWFWIIAAVIILVGLIIFLRIDMKESGKRIRDYSGIRDYFGVYAEGLYSLWAKVWPDWYRVEDYFYEGEISKDLELLYPGNRRRELFLKHTKSKVAVALMVATVISLTGVLVCAADLGKHFLEDGKIKRNEYGGGEKQVSVIAKYQDQSKKIDVTVGEKEYTKEEMESIFESEFVNLEEIFLKDNKSFEAIAGPVNPVDSCHEGIIEVSWRFSDYEVLDGDGNFHKERLKELLEESDSDVYPGTVTAILNYRDIKKEKTWDVGFVMGDSDGEESIAFEMESAIRQAEKKSLTEDYYTLPSKVLGMDVSWQEPPAGGHGALAVMGLLAVAAIFPLMDYELKNKVKARDEELLLDYSDFVSKISILLTAGISLTNAWSRISKSYEEKVRRGGRKRYLYEEMLICEREMANKTSGALAIEHFGERCGIPCYKRFATLIIQGMKKGMSGLEDSLALEVKDSFELRKNKAKALGEEASSKLLIPMAMMLGVVLIILIAPAFMSLSV